MAIIFNTRVLHDRIELFPGVSLAFEDANAETYFINAGWAATTDDPPVRTYTADEISIDVETTIAGGPNAGKLVMEV